MKKKSNSDDWDWDSTNAECNYDISGQEGVELLLEGLNERCRSLGPCGAYVNIAGELGSDEGYRIQRTKISSSVDANYPITGYNMSQEYLSSLSGKPGLIQVGSITSLTGAVISMIAGWAVAGSPAFPDHPPPQGFLGRIYFVEAALDRDLFSQNCVCLSV